MCIIQHLRKFILQDQNIKFEKVLSCFNNQYMPPGYIDIFMKNNFKVFKSEFQKCDSDINGIITELLFDIFFWKYFLVNTFFKYL